MPALVKDRIDIRISREQKEFIKYASELRGFKSLSEFVIYCISNEATKIVHDNSVIVKTLEDKRIFVNAILNPPAPNSKLKEAQLNYQKFMTNNGFKNSTSKKKS